MSKGISRKGLMLKNVSPNIPTDEKELDLKTLMRIKVSGTLLGRGS